MTIRGLLTDLIVPPPNLLYWAIAGLILLSSRRWRRWGVTMLVASVAGLAILALPAVGQALIVSLEAGLPLRPPAGQPPQAIVILSADLERTRAGDVVGALTLERLAAGVRLWRRLHLPILVSGGRLKPEDEPLAALMARSLRDDFEVPATWIEDRSSDTWQNAADSAAMLRPLGISSVYVVTHAWHERRAVIAFQHFGLIATAAPVTLDAMSWGWLPETGGWSRSYYALHEWIGIVTYWLHAGLAPVPPFARSVPSSKAA